LLIQRVAKELYVGNEITDSRFLSYKFEDLITILSLREKIAANKAELKLKKCISELLTQNELIPNLTEFRELIYNLNPLGMEST